MTISMRFVHVVLFALAAATATAAQTLTVNKFQQNLAGAPIATAGVGMKMNYVIVITSSDITKNSAVTVTDTLPTGFVPLTTPGCVSGASSKR